MIRPSPPSSPRMRRTCAPAGKTRCGSAVLTKRPRPLRKQPRIELEVACRVAAGLRVADRVGPAESLLHPARGLLRARARIGKVIVPAGAPQHHVAEVNRPFLPAEVVHNVPPK